MKRIDSKENPRFKELLRIRKNSGKDRDAEVFIEGLRLCTDAAVSGVFFETVLISQANESDVDLSSFMDASEVLILAEPLFHKLCSTQNPQGIAAIVKSPVIHKKETIQIRPKDRFLICESIQDPGNFGSIIRTADAFGFTGVIFTKDTVDPFNEKVLRSSMGSIFHVKLICTENILETLSWLKSGGVTSYAAHLRGENLTKNFMFKMPCAVMLGNEGQGIRTETAEHCDRLIRIPMPGKAESLNVSNAAAILSCLVSMQD